MLKITAKRGASEDVLELEGRLAGPWVTALAGAWNELVDRGEGHAIRVDLADVTFVDRAGQDLLTALCRAGARLAGAGCLTTSILEEITRRAEADERAHVPPAPLVHPPASPERRHP
jgi:anti-anti-sigma regulatory factor